MIFFYYSSFPFCSKLCLVFIFPLSAMSSSGSEGVTHYMCPFIRLSECECIHQFLFVCTFSRRGCVGSRNRSLGQISLQNKAQCIKTKSWSFSLPVGKSKTNNLLFQPNSVLSFNTLLSLLFNSRAIFPIHRNIQIFVNAV